jgi:[acyl-carrier-protein] S-malonyltransferase
MGKDLFERSPEAQAMFQEANSIMGFDLAQIMFTGTPEELTQTSVTQPAIYLHSVVLAHLLGVQQDAAMAAGHSLGEFSALAAMGALSWTDGLRLVKARAEAMQAACNAEPSTMAAIIGMDDAAVEALCNETEGIVVPANYNSPGQLVISGATAAVQAAVELAKTRGARMAKVLQVNGAFHSPLMEPARASLASAIAATEFRKPAAPIYQNVNARGETDPQRIQQNLIAQLTAPVRWTQTLEQMFADGLTRAVEVGPGNVLQGLAKRTLQGVEVAGFSSLPA